jgi:multiple sugar transport system substrate-binding protein
MVDNSTHTDRRKFLKLLGASSLSTVAGCVGIPGIGGGGNGSGDQTFLEAADQMNIGQNLRDRRLATTKEWPIEKRKNVPERDSDTSWKGSGSFKSAPWSPPEGWKDTPAGEVDQLDIINHGALTMEFDPATLATHEIFERETGIKLNPIEVGVTKANKQEQQLFRAEESSPQLMNINGSLVPQFVSRGYLTPVDALYPSQSVWDMYSPGLRDMVQLDIDPTREGTHAYGFPNIGEVTIGHLRTDLVEEQGLDPQRYQGEWSWDLLEETMRAFKDTGIAGYAYFAGTPTYLSYSFRTLLYAQGGQLVQDDGTVRVDTPAAIRTTAKMAEWYQKGWVPADVISYTEGDIVDLYLSNQLAVATVFGGLTPLALNNFKRGEEYLAVVPPKATSGPNPAQRPLLGPNATGINAFSDTAHSLAALLYGDLRLSYVSQWWEYTYEGNISYIGKVYDDAAQYDFTPFATVYGKAVGNAFVELFPGMQNLFVQMTTPIQDAIQGRRTPEKAMQDIQNWVDENINQGN